MTSADKRTLLLVEDEAILAMTEKMSLEQYGYSVITVNTGEKAIEIMKTSPGISLILMDIDLGKGIDGTEAASIIQRDHDIPIIFVSSHCEREIVEKAEKITSYGYVVKSSSITVLDASIKMAFKLFEAKNVYKDTFIFSINGLCIHKMLYDEDRKQFDFEYMHVNPEFEKQTGLSAGMVIGKTIRQLYSDNEVDEVINLYLGVMESGVPIRKETFFEPIDRWFLLSVFPMHDKLLTVAMQNITEQKHNAEKLHQSEEEHRRLFTTMSPGVIYQSADGLIISANPSAEKLLGLTVDQMNGKTSMDPRWKMINEQGEEVPGSEHPTMQTLRTGKKVGPVDRALFIPEKNAYVWLSITAIPLFNPGDPKPYQVYATFDDITGRKQNERLLGEKEALFRGLFDHMTSGSAVYEVRNDGSKGRDYIIRYFNQKSLELEGKKLEEVLGKSLFDLRPNIDDYGLIGAMKNVWETGIPMYFPTKIYQDEQYSNYYENQIFRLPSGEIVTIYNDVTKEKNQEEELRSLVEELQAANEEMQAQNEEMQVQNEELQYAYEAIRNKEEELRRIEWLLTSRPKVSEAQKDSYIPPYGDLIALNTCRLILDSVGEQTLTDIASDYLNLLDTSSAVYEKDGDYALGLFSSGWCRFMDAASRALCNTKDNREALDGGHWHCHESCWSQASKTAIETGQPADIECAGGIHLYAVPIRLGDEIIGAINFGYGDPPRDEKKLRELAVTYKVSYEELRTQAMNYESRPPYIIDLAKQRLLASARLLGDITGRRQAETGMKELLAEKELVLKEVNHRIKNNMNAMRSLFQLQAKRMSDTSAAAVLEDASNRMQSMEILYDQLYQAASYSELSIKAYVSSLVDAVIGNFPQGYLVRIEKHIDDFILDAKRLQPLGVIINELLTNTMKYAFPDKSTGLITVSIQLVKGHITLALQDNGTGIPVAVDFENSTGFGLTLVKALAAQLDGTIRIERLDGTRVVLEFDQ